MEKAPAGRTAAEQDHEPDRPGSARREAEAGRAQQMLRLQRAAGNAAVARLVTGLPVQRGVVLGPADAREDRSEGIATEADPGAGKDLASGEVSGISGGEDAPPDAGADGAEDGKPGAPTGEGGGDGEDGAGEAAEEQEKTGGGTGPAELDLDALKPSSLDPPSAALVADLAKEFGSGADEKSGKPHPLLRPEMRNAAAEVLPDRAKDLGVPVAQRTAQSPVVQRELAVQRQGTIPTIKVKMTVPNWKNIDLFKTDNPSSWFILGGEIESPKWEGEATPPKHLHDEKKEAELQIDANGKLKGYAATFHKEVLAKSGDTKVSAKVQVEVTDQSVKVSGFEVDSPKLFAGGKFAKDKIEFDVFEWKQGEGPSFMIFSYTYEPKIESNASIDGWGFKGTLSLPIKFSIKPNPVKVADYVVRTIGPRLAAAAPGALAAGAPLAAGAVCVALWVNAIEAGKDFGTAIGMAQQNTKGYVVAFVGTIFEHKGMAYSNAGAAAGKADAQKVLDGLHWSELPEAARAEMREKFLSGDVLGVPAAQRAMWKKFRAESLAWYRARHGIDAWAYDHGLPSDLGKLGRLLNKAGPPWPISNY